MREHEQERQYSFALPPNRSIFLGLSGAEAAMAGAALVAGGLMLAMHVPVPIAALPAVLVLVGTLRIVRGDNLFAWAIPAATYVLGSRSWRGGLDTGVMASASLSRDAMSPYEPSPPMPAEKAEVKPWRRAVAAHRHVKAQRLPVEMRGMSIRPLGAHGNEIGLVSNDRTRDVYTAVAQVSSTDAFVLMPSSERSTALASFGAIMDGTCTEDARVRCVSWCERVVPDLGDQADVWLEATAGDARLRDDYEALVDQLDASAQLHEVYLALSVHAEGKQWADEVEYEVRQFFAQFAALNYRTDVLSSADLHVLVQATLEGMPRAYYQTASPSLSAPSAEDVGWTQIHLDGMFHRASVVASWPRVPVGSRALAPMLQAQIPGVTRTVTMHWQPTKPSTAQRRIRMQVAKAEMDRIQRAERGKVRSARVDREVQDAMRRDEEQTAGYAEHRIAAVSLISAPSQDLLDSGSRRLVQGAIRSHLELRPLYGRQREGWVAALPFGQMRFENGILEF
ncbi:MAG: SCO6880 family protein [Acidimicrobiales bacterium]